MLLPTCSSNSLFKSFTCEDEFHQLNNYLEDSDLFGLEWSGFHVTASLFATAFLFVITFLFVIAFPFVAALLFAAVVLFVALWGIQRCGCGFAGGLISGCQLKSTPVQITCSLAHS